MEEQGEDKAGLDGWKDGWVGGLVAVIKWALILCMMAYLLRILGLSLWPQALPQLPLITLDMIPKSPVDRVANRDPRREWRGEEKEMAKAKKERMTYKHQESIEPS